MIDLPIFFAGSDPLSHVLDHSTWLTSFTGITKHVMMLMIASGLCLWIFPKVAKGMAGGKTGGRFGMFFEALLLLVRDEMVRPFLGKDGDRFLPVIWTFFFVILFCNLLGMIPGSATATGNISVTVALAGVACVFYHFHGIKENGFVHYLQALLLVGPKPLWPLMIPIEMFGHIVRPCALAVRLFANMVGGHVLLAVIMSFTVITDFDSIFKDGSITLVSAVAALALNFLELMVAGIQAVVFTFLTTVFLSLSVHPEH